MLSDPQSLEDQHHKRYHAELTEAGRHKLQANTTCSQDSELHPGIDYCVNSNPNSSWLSFPDIPSTQYFCHTWIIENRRRYAALLFVGSPVPVQRADSFERSAMLTMSYVHPWTLRQEDAEENDVPFAGCLRKNSTWETSLANWLDGNVISKESAKYISNVLIVSTAYVPVTYLNDDARSDEDFSDEEFVLTEAQLAAAL